MRVFGRLAFVGLLALCVALPLLYSAPVFVDVGGSPRPRFSDPTTFDVFVEDAPFLEQVNEPEPAELTDPAQTTFRWLQPQATLRVPLWGRSATLVHLRVLPPPEPTIPLTLSVTHASMYALLTPEPRTISWFVPLPDNDQLTIAVESPAFVPPNDPRSLGVALDYIHVVPVQSSLRFAWPVWALAFGLVSLFGALLLTCRFTWLTTMFGCAVVTLALVYGLLWHRELTALGLPRWFVLAASSTLVVLGWTLYAQRWSRLSGAAQLVGTRLFALSALGWCVRMAGLWHPQVNTSDLQLHVNNVVEVLRGGIFFTEGLPPEAGGGRSPYPSLVYVLVQPLLLVWRNPATLPMLTLGFTAFLDMLVIPALWWAVYRHNQAWRERWAWFAASLYVVPLTVLRSLTIGELTNVGGQAVAVIMLLLTIKWLQQGASKRWMPAVTMGLLVAAWGHLGVLAALVLTGALWALGLFMQRSWLAVRSLTLVGFVGVTAALALYYTVFVGDPTLQADPSLEIPVFALSTKLATLFQVTLWRWDAEVWWPWWVAAMLGIYALRLRAPEWRLPLVAWLGSGVIAWVSLLWSAQTIRWWLWVVPALCLATGAFLAHQERRWLVSGLWMLLQLSALVWWLQFMISYRTGNFIF